MKGITIVSRYRTSDGQEFDLCSDAESHQRVLDWQRTFTEDTSAFDFGSTFTLQELNRWAEDRIITYGAEGKVQLRVNDMGEITAHLKKGIESA